ncbi:hypothetical protein [Streptomyces sp. TS71-3]|uniref:hypothetical protein n=1 Tax=Streptomyces sp. TS71-3 TaxID=2733862 RepID=UPI001B0B9699|nr:hypothetical protein [Streptomyces sp. TS71-3]GHJ40870.1 hypothetical protein Sm713_64790 [Streptomyces sp. TS71-3]
MPASPAVFLTAAQWDRASLTALDRRLRRRGVRTGVDPERVQTDDLLPEPVLQDLGACDALVAVWSEAAAGDPFVEAHLETAASFGKRAIRYTPNGDAQFETLLCDLYGDAPVPAPREPAGVAVDPGRWRITDHDAALELDLVLGPDGRATGTGTARDRTGRVSGSWRYDAPEEELALDLRITIGLRPTPLALLLCPTGRDGDRIHAADAHGLAAPHTYTVVPVSENGADPR